MKRMLFNATQQEELRVAIVDGQKLIDIDIETAGRELRKSNIYKGVITRIEPSLEACFVNYGEERHGFLPFKEVARSYFRDGADPRTANIKEALREGQEIVVQVEKEERGNKGAALTSFVSLAGRYLVLMPNNPRGGGVSRRVEGEDRQELRDTMDKLDLPPGMSVIARTAGIGRNVDELQWDLNYLMQLWRAIEGASKSASGAFLIYQESSLVIRAIRDYFQPDIGEILIDTDDIYEQAQQFMSHVMPDMVHRVKRYSDDVPLFSRFQIEHQIETAYSRTVPLPSGGAIVIDHTEALVSVDVNSARATRGADIETTAFHTNCEAAEEVARQLRLRDLGGLIVIDFIDMENSKNQREVETRLKDALRYDRARVQMGKISRFGLMELSRQRLRPSLSEGSHVTCPRCNGTGHIRDTESSALQVLRIIQEEAMKENSAAIHVQSPVDVAAFLLNEKRGEILKIETRHRVTVILIPNKHLETPHYKVDRLKFDDPRLEESHASYAMAEQVDTDIGYSKNAREDVKPRQEAVVKSITPDTAPAPTVERHEPAPVAAAAPAAELVKKGLFSRLFGWLSGATEEAAPVAAPVVPGKSERDRADRGERGGRNRNRNRNRNGRDGEESLAKAGNAGAKQTKPVLADATGAESRQPKGQRPPRGERQERTDKTDRPVEQRAERAERPERESQEARRERQQREREERIAKKAAAADVAALEDARQISLPETEQSADGEEMADQVAKPELAEGEEPRRRRRRGGRNRNRRDRDGSEAGNAEAGTREGSDDFVPVADLAQAEQQHLQADHVDTHEQPAHGHTDDAAQQMTFVAETVVVETVAPAAAATSVPTQVELTFEPAAHAQAVADAEPSVPVQVDVPAAPAPAAAQHADAAVDTSAVDTAAVDTAAADVPPVVIEPVPAAPVASAITVAPVATAAPVTKVEDLNDMLASAGLVLASTDPEKLRSAQAYTAPVAEPRPARSRKPPVQISSEPLQLVQTKQPPQQ